MTQFIAKGIRFRNGEHHSVLNVPGGLPVHAATLFLARFRTKGRAANTIHRVCNTLALVHRWLCKSEIDLLQRLRQGQFLTLPEISRFAEVAQRHLAELSSDSAASSSKSNVVDLRRARMRRTAVLPEAKGVEVTSQATRLRYAIAYLGFLATYFASALPSPQRREMELESERVLNALREHIPPVPKRAKLGSRQALSGEEQARVVAVVHPDSPQNPWKRGFVRQRNWLIVVLLLATGMRRGELLGMQLGDLNPRLPKMRIVRRADAPEDPRALQPNTKTGDREIELRPAIMRAVWDHIKARRQIRAARKYSQLIVADNGKPLSAKSIDKIFSQLRAACPGLPVRLTSHVTRHTWNERFSEQAELMGVSNTVEERARNEQQGWADNSKSSVNYTRRYTTRKGREISLKLQENLNVQT